MPTTASASTSVFGNFSAAAVMNRKLTVALVDDSLSTDAPRVGGGGRVPQVSWSCLAVGRAHRADVYALTSHPSRPFVFLSASRDTTIRLWTLCPLFSSLFAELSIAGLALTSSSSSSASSSGNQKLLSEWTVSKEVLCAEMLTEGDASDIVLGDGLKRHVQQYATDGFVSVATAMTKSSLSSPRRDSSRWRHC